MKSIFAIAAIVALVGCTTYTLEDQKYNSREAFLSAASQKASEAVNEIQPLPKTLTEKNLIFARSSINMTTENVRQMNRNQENKEIDGGQMQIVDSLLKSGFISTNAFRDAIKRRNIYKAVDYVEISSPTGLPEATKDTDVLYFLTANGNNGQWYYVTKKSGTQVFPVDQSLRTARGQVKAFVEAAQAAALRD